MVWEDFVPEILRFPLMLLIIVIYMLSGGVYMSAVAFIVCDYVCMVCHYLPLVVLMSFISGFFRILSTFVCWSNIQLRITPDRDFAIFFPFLFTFVLGSVQLTDIVTGYCVTALDWRAMHRLTIGAFILVFALVYFCMRRGYRPGPYMPFKGIDYLGGILWSLWLTCIVFIFVYGEHYDWFDSAEIRTAAVFAVVLLVMCLERAASIRHPYISLKTFSQRNMPFIFILFGCMSLMSTMVSSVQNVYTGAVLGFDARHNADLLWGVVAGIAVGTGVFYVALKKWKWRVKSIVCVGFVSFLLYFLIDASAEKYMLYLPMLFKGAGVSIVYTSLTYALAGCVTFAYYFEAMCVIGFIRTSFGGPLNAAVITRLLNGIKHSATADLGSHVDMMHPMADSFTAVYGEFQRQMLMVSLKEIYGYAAIAAVVILLAILASDYRHYVGSRINRMLKLPQVWRRLHSRTT